MINKKYNNAYTDLYNYFQLQKNIWLSKIEYSVAFILLEVL